LTSVGSFALAELAAERDPTMNPTPTLPLDNTPESTRVGPHWFKELPKHQEDSSFCARVRAGGGRVVVDTRICGGHGPGTNPVYWWTKWVNERAPKSGVAPIRVVA
jgi:hypothetical protein